VTAPDAPAFEAALKKLEEIVQRLERGELPLEESLKLYEEGIQLSRVCHARLDEAEGRIEQLLKDARGEVRLDASGKPRTAPLAAPEGDSDR
jgi:exodeoxyribonuclease VII small subunit